MGEPRLSRRARFGILSQKVQLEPAPAKNPGKSPAPGASGRHLPSLLVYQQVNKILRNPDFRNFQCRNFSPAGCTRKL